MSILPEQQSLGSKASYTKKKSAAKTKEKEPVRPHVKASLEDINWVRSQPPCVQQLWLDCVAVEQFGGQQREVKTSLSRNAFSKAKSALEGKGLFRFEQIYAPAKSGRGFVTGWKVENLHGYYKKKYWELDVHEVTTESQKITTESQTVTAESHKKTPDGHFVCNTILETHTTTDARKNQPLLNQHSTTPQPPTKVVEEGVSIPPEETQQPPLGGAAATNGGMPEEEAGVDSSTSLKDHPESSSVEPQDLGGDKCSVAEGNIAIKLANDAFTDLGCDRCSLGQPEMGTIGSQTDLEVNHAEIVEAICQQASIHYYSPTEAEREQLMGLTAKQLEVVSVRFQQQMARRSFHRKTSEYFQFALTLGKHSAKT